MASGHFEENMHTRVVGLLRVSACAAPSQWGRSHLRGLERAPQRFRLRTPCVWSSAWLPSKWSVGCGDRASAIRRLPPRAAGAPRHS